MDQQGTQDYALPERFTTTHDVYSLASLPADGTPWVRWSDGSYSRLMRPRRRRWQ